MSKKQKAVDEKAIQKKIDTAVQKAVKDAVSFEQETNKIVIKMEKDKVLLQLKEA